MIKRTALLLAAVFAIVAAVPALASANTFEFQTPSHNIACALSSSGVRCDIGNRDWSAPAKPASCHLDYGNGLILGRSGRAMYSCAGDTVLNSSDYVLAYGKTARAGSFSCSSAITGITCRHGGHGFFLSIQSVRLF